jgi:hypothetical protein
VKVGFLSSWNTRCGIAEYTRHLAGALRRRGDVDVEIFGSRNAGDRAVRPYEDWAHPVFDVLLWSPEWANGLDVEFVLEADLDVLHVQYSNIFFDRRRLVQLMERFPGVLAVTYHDKAVPPSFPYRMPDLLYAHREDVGIGPRTLIPQGVELDPPVVKTFGLGKSRDDLVSELCERNSWRFESSFGGSRWLEAEELRAWLRDSDAIVLWYDPDPLSGGSAAAPLAIGTRRPVFVNSTEWFSDLPERTKTLTKVETLEQLEADLREQFSDPYAEERSWNRVAARLVSDYERVRAVGPGLHRGGPRAQLFAVTDNKPLISWRRRRRQRRELAGNAER